MNQGMIEGYVNGGCMMFVLDACTAQQKKDVLDCTLYAQLAATKKHARFEASEQWSQVFLAAMVRFGWVLKSNCSNSLPASELGAGSVWNWVSDHLPAFISAPLFEHEESMVRAAMLNGSSVPAIELLTRQAFDTTTHGNQKVVLQMGKLSANSDLSLVTVSFTHKHPLSADFLVTEINPEDVIGNVVLNFHSVQLMDIVYTPLRAAIDEALKGLRPQLLRSLQETVHDL